MELLLLWSSQPSLLLFFDPLFTRMPSSTFSSFFFITLLTIFFITLCTFSSHTLMEPKSSSTMKAMEPKLSFKERVLPKKETSSIAYDFEDEDENDVDDDYRYDGKVMFKEDNGINKKKKTVATVSGGRSGGGSGGVVGGVGSPCCQAEKCGVDLTDAKRYHRRHKVCEVHAKAPAVEVAGLRQRFCQQCSRFHELSEFDEAKRSCRRRLAGHNERRRKGVIEPQNGEGSGGKEKENHWRQAEERTAAIVEINPSYKHLQIR